MFELTLYHMKVAVEGRYEDPTDFLENVRAFACNCSSFLECQLTWFLCSF